MNRYKANGVKTVDSLYKVPGKTKWDLKEKLLLGLTPWQYIIQAVRNPFNWILAAIFAVGLPHSHPLHLWPLIGHQQLL